jgi:hypothetical protein
MRRLEQALYMDRNTIPNITTTSFAFEQKYTDRNTIPNIYNTSISEMSILERCLY